jgi:hypothetical protein
LANLPLILGLLSAYTFLEAYRMVLSNLRFFRFSLYLKTLASLFLGSNGFTPHNDANGTLAGIAGLS